jgi:hypothetical protein
MEKGVNSVCCPCTMAPVSSPWTQDMAMAGRSPELLLPTDSNHGGPMGVGEKEEGATGGLILPITEAWEAAHQRLCFSSEGRQRGRSRE